MLRDFQPKDVFPYIEMTQHAEYQRFYVPEDCSHSKAVSLVRHFINTATDYPRAVYQLVVIEKTLNSFIGTVGLRMQANYSASIGFGFDVRYQGQGFAFEAISELMLFADRQLSVTSFFADTIEQNVKAINLCQKLGFSDSGNRRVQHTFRGQTWDEIRLIKS